MSVLFHRRFRIGSMSAVESHSLPIAPSLVSGEEIEQWDSSIRGELLEVRTKPFPEANAAT
jgi:hypothetical protein